MKYPAYPRYKPSGIEWLGEVPEHWEVRRLAYEARLQGGYAFKSDTFCDEGIPVVQMNNLQAGLVRVETAKCIPPEESLTDFALRTGDILMGMTGSLENCARIEMRNLPAQLNQRVGRFILHPTLSTGFLWNLIQSLAFKSQVQLSAAGTAQLNISSAQIESVIFSFPPLPEQLAIADFLDVETAKLDTLVGKKRELIEKLKEKRTVLISRTVTRGLPPEAARAAGLNPNPKLKPSGIEWLGEIPEHWETPPLYTRYRIELGKMLDESRITGNHLVPYLRNVDVQWDAINTSDLPEMDIREDEYSRYTLSAGDLLVCEGGEAGRAAIFQQFTSFLGFQKALHRLRAIDSNDLPRFLYSTLYWASHFGIFLAEGNPNTIPHLTGEKLRRYRFPKPPLPEQYAIANYLDRETAKIDRMVEKVEAAVERLQEYRTALITAAVTGKIDVRTKL